MPLQYGPNLLSEQLLGFPSSYSWLCAYIILSSSILYLVRQVYLCWLPRKQEGRFKAIEKLSHSVLKAKVQHRRASRGMLSRKAPEKAYLRPFSVALGFSGSLYSPWTAILMTPLASPASHGPPLCINVVIFSSDKVSSHTFRAQLHTFIRHDFLLIWFHLQNLLLLKSHIHSYLLWEVRSPCNSADDTAMPLSAPCHPILQDQLFPFVESLSLHINNSADHLGGRHHTHISGPMGEHKFLQFSSRIYLVPQCFPYTWARMSEDNSPPKKPFEWKKTQIAKSWIRKGRRRRHMLGSQTHSPGL